MATEINQIVLTLHVASVEETAGWYERVLGWTGHFDTFDAAGHCLFGSVMLQEEPFAGFNLARAAGDRSPAPGSQCASWIYVADVDIVYEGVVKAGWPADSMPRDQFWGERLFRLKDLNGHPLVITQSIEDLGLDEIRERHEALLEA